MLRFYTVDLNTPGFPVQYIDPTDKQIKTFAGNHADPGEASLEFSATLSPEETACYLSTEDFKTALLPAAFQATCEACGISFKPEQGYYEPDEYSYCRDCCTW